jgi:PAS domain S-box-containing protein
MVSVTEQGIRRGHVAEAAENQLILLVVAFDSRGRAFATALAEAGHRVVLVTEADAVSDSFRHEDIDAAFVCGAPAECAARLRQLRHSHDVLAVPIFRIGFDSEVGAERDAASAGLDGYIHAAGGLDTAVRTAERALLRALASRRRIGSRFMDTVLDVVCVVDRADHFVDLSPSCHEVLGFRPDELIGRSIFSRCHPDDLERTVTEMQQLGIGASNHGFENRYLRKSGEIVHLLWSQQWSDSAGWRYIVARDVTERRTRLSRYESFFELSSDLLAVVGFDGVIHHHNHTVASLFSRTRGDLIGRPMFDFVRFEDLAHSRQALLDGVSGGNIPALEIQMNAVDGSRRLISWTGRIVWDEKLIYAVGRDITESRSIAERLRGMLEGMSDAFFAIDRNWCLTFVNPIFMRDLGLPESELLGRPVFDVIPELREPQLYPHYLKAIETGEPRHFENLSSINQRFYEIHIYPTPHDIGVYYRDITERRLVDGALRKSEERLRFLSNATSDAIWEWNIDTNIVWRSESFGPMFGYTTEESVNSKNFWETRLHPDELPRLMSDVQRLLSSREETFGSEYRFLRADGSWAWVQDRGSVIRDADGQALRMIGGMTDITEQRASEDRLLAQAALLDAARDAILVRAVDGTITYWNRGAERIYGWSSEEALGLKMRDLICLDPATYDTANSRLGTHGEWTGEIAQKTRDGREILVDGRWTRITDREGREQVLVINTDITERRKLEQQFLRAQRMESIGTLAGGIAHDLNNILAPILMSVDLLREQFADSGASDVLDAVKASARRGADLVRQVLSFARGVGGERVIIDPRPIVREVRKILLETLPRTIRFECDLRGKWLLRADPTQIHQVLMNLCINARDAMPKGGMLHVAVEDRSIDDARHLESGARVGAFIQFTIRDTGHGMTPDVLARIFDPFFTTKPVGSGTGLGLPTVQAIIKSHRGWLTVESEPNRGATFRFNLPAEAAVLPQLAPLRPVLEKLRASGQMILLVDDEQSIRTVTGQALANAGFRVLVARDGVEAMSVFGSHSDDIALVVTDMMMPVMDGAATIKALRQLRPSLPIIATSGISSNGNAVVASGLGAQGFLEKPFGIETLLTCIFSILSPAE